MKRRLVDMQYYNPEEMDEDLLLIHEVLEDGTRHYSVINNLNLHFGVLKGEPEKKKYFVKKDELTWYKVPYADKGLEIAKILGYDIKELKKLSGKDFYDAIRNICSDYRLYFADNDITFQERINYYKKNSDQLDPTIKMNICSFDIEVHSDYTFTEYQFAKKIIASRSLDELRKSKKYKETILKLINNNPIMRQVCTLKDENFVNKMLTKESIETYLYNYPTLKYYLVLTANPAFAEDHFEFLKKVIDEYLIEVSYHEKMGFPDEEKAENRIDAISLFSTKHNTMYYYLLNTFIDYSEEFSYIFSNDSDEEEFKEDLRNYLILFNCRIYTINDKKLKEDNKELLDEVTDFLAEYPTKKTNINLIKEYIEKFKGIVPNELLEMKLVYKHFDNEIDLITDFFITLREEIKPNFLVAHNVKFDFLTLYNRIKKYGLDPQDYFNQYDISDGKLPIKYRIDYRAPSYKKDKSYFNVPGLVILDTQLLVAKLMQRERDFSLDALAKDFLNESKFEFDADSITVLYNSNLRHFSYYSCIDTLLVHWLVEKLLLIEQFDSVLTNSYSVWKDYSSKSVYLTNSIKQTLAEKFGLITRVNTRRIDPPIDRSFEGAFVTDPEVVETYGLHDHAYDIDAKAFYPNTIISMNAMTDKLILDMLGSDAYLDYLIMTRMNYGHKYFGLDSPAEIYEEL
jgi:DNA polymerase III epsilon subunit-like protein